AQWAIGDRIGKFIVAIVFIAKRSEGGIFPAFNSVRFCRCVIQRLANCSVWPVWFDRAAPVTPAIEQPNQDEDEKKDHCNDQDPQEWLQRVHDSVSFVVSCAQSPTRALDNHPC